MHHRLTRILTATLLLTSSKILNADITLIHAGKMLAVPGQAAKQDQTIVIADERILDVRDGFLAPAEFDGDVSVIDLKDRFVLPGLMDMHVHLQGELGPEKDRESLKMSSQQIEMRSVMFAMRTMLAGFTTVRDV